MTMTLKSLTYQIPKCNYYYYYKEVLFSNSIKPNLNTKDEYRIEYTFIFIKNLMLWFEPEVPYYFF